MSATTVREDAEAEGIIPHVSFEEWCAEFDRLAVIESRSAEMRGADHRAAFDMAYTPSEALHDNDGYA